MQGKRHLRFTIYDLRFTIYDLRFGKFARVARDAERMQSGILKAMRGRGYKAAVAADAAYVRFINILMRINDDIGQ